MAYAEGRQGCWARLHTAKTKQRQRLTSSSGYRDSTCLGRQASASGLIFLLLAVAMVPPMKLLLTFPSIKPANSWLRSCHLVLCNARAHNLPSVCPQQHSTPSWRVLFGSSLWSTNRCFVCSIRGLRSCLTTWRTISAEKRLYRLTT